MIHFHIRWSDSKLDWKAFQTPEEAMTQANELVRPGGTYVIEELDGACPRCRNLPRAPIPVRDNALNGSELS